MKLEQLAGNEALKRQLSAQAKGRGLSHAYLISGPAGSGKRTLSRLLAAAMVCTGEGEAPCGICPGCKKALGGIHPDIMVLGEEDKEITVGQARTVRSDAYIRPNEGERKVYLLEEADQMNPSAQNAMLKLLEEGPAYAAFLLLAENAGGLLQTVRSRCEELSLIPAGEPGDQEGRALAKNLADALSRAGELELLEAAMVLDGKRNREELSALLEAVETELADRAAEGGDRRRLLRAVELIQRLRGAARLNVNAGQLSGWLCAGMFDTL